MSATDVTSRGDERQRSLESERAQDSPLSFLKEHRHFFSEELAKLDLIGGSGEDYRFSILINNSQMTSIGTYPMKLKKVRTPSSSRVFVDADLTSIKRERSSRRRWPSTWPTDKLPSLRSCANKYLHRRSVSARLETNRA